MNSTSSIKDDEEASYSQFESGTSLKSDSVIIDPQTNRYPYCIVFTRAPRLTWCLPCFGHVGIAGADGRIHDYAGNTVDIDNLAYDRPYKYIQLDVGNINPTIFDDGLEKADQGFHETKYNFLKHNCYHYVANALSEANYKKKKKWTQFDIMRLTMCGGRFIRKSVSENFKPAFVSSQYFKEITASDSFQIIKSYRYSQDDKYAYQT